MKTIFQIVAVLAVTLSSMSARAQSCTPVFNQMKSFWQLYQLKTSITMMSNQTNTLRTYAGAHQPVEGSPQYEARMVPHENGSWLTTAVPGGVPGLQQFSDRFSTTITARDQNYSVDLPHLETIDIWMGENVVMLFNRNYTYTITINNPRCENGVIWGFGEPIGNHNTRGSRALYVFSYGFASL
jgi:hypothetical protein